MIKKCLEFNTFKSFGSVVCRNRRIELINVSIRHRVLDSFLNAIVVPWHDLVKRRLPRFVEDLHNPPNFGL